MGIRDVLLLVFAGAWLSVVLITAWRTGGVPPELWAVLGVGVGGLIAVFRADTYTGNHREHRGTREADEVEDSE